MNEDQKQEYNDAYAKFSSKNRQKQAIYDAYAKFEEATIEYQKAIMEFKAAYDPETVGLDEFGAHIYEVVEDIETDIYEAFGDEEIEDA